MAMSKKPLTSACRQRAIAAVAEDIENMNHVVDEPHEEPYDPVTSDVCDDSQSFPGGPQDTSMFTSYMLIM